jgi:predicted TIM-barrel fold metal-dependent hydrolase
VTALIIDSDQHLYEPRGMWADHAPGADRDEALEFVDDDLGYTYLTWRGRRLGLADVHQPGDTASNGRHRIRHRRGEEPEYRYDEALPAEYWDPDARMRWLDGAGLDEAVCFPNFGLLWERDLSGSLPALAVNMGTWNRRAVEVTTGSRGRLHVVGHLTLRHPDWAIEQLAALGAGGVRMAMIAPAPVDGRPLSHPDHDRLWAAFVEHGVTPVFHVADQPRVFDDCWYGDPSDEGQVPATESVFLWVPPALAVTDMIINGVFDRHPELRVGIVELSSIWVPQYLLMLDGGVEFTSKLNGTGTPLKMKPSDYFLRHVRVSSFSYEAPARLQAKSADIYMCCSDYPHSEGTDHPVADYAAAGCDLESGAGGFAGLARGNVDYLLHTSRQG